MTTDGAFAGLAISAIGNCHASVIGRMLEHFLGEAGWIRVFKLDTPWSEEDRRWIAASDLVVKQTGDFAAGSPALDTGRARVVPFPLVSGQFLWPFNTKGHPRNAETITPWRPTGLFHFQVVDSQLIRLMARRAVGPESTDREIEDLLDEYLGFDYAAMIRLERLFEISREKMRRAADVVGYDLWRVVERDFRAIPTFITALHPEPNLLLALCEELLPRLGLGIAREAVAPAFDEVYDGDHVFHYGAPVHPSVLAHFRINWPGDPPRFRFGKEMPVNAREFAERIVRLDAGEPVRELFARVTQGESAVGLLPEIAAMEAAQSANPMFRLQYGNLLAKIGRERQALEQYAAGVRLAPGHLGLARKLARMTARLGLSDLAELPVDGRPILFSAGQPGERFLAENWYPGDERGAWMRGHAASIAFRLSEGRRASLQLRFRTRCYATERRALQVRAFANGREVGVWIFRDSVVDIERIITLPPDLAAERAIQIQFFADQPVRPSEVANIGDTRLLGLGLRQLSARFVAMQQAERIAL
jgi:hypothetical protein